MKSFVASLWNVRSRRDESEIIDIPRLSDQEKCHRLRLRSIDKNRVSSKFTFSSAAVLLFATWLRFFVYLFPRSIYHRLRFNPISSALFVCVHLLVSCGFLKCCKLFVCPNKAYCLCGNARSLNTRRLFFVSYIFADCIFKTACLFLFREAPLCCAFCLFSLSFISFDQ